MGNFLKYVNKSKKNEEESKASSTSSQLGNFGKYAFNQEIKTLQSDLTSLSKTIDNVYKGWQTRETMDNTRSSIQSMYDRLGKYQEYTNKYGGADLSALQTSYKEILDGWRDLSKSYAGYKSADEYNEAVKKAGEKAMEIEGMKTADLGKVQTEITDLDELLKNANKYENNINTLRNSQSMVGNRSYGLNTNIYDNKIAEAENEYKEYLKSIGYDSVDALKKALGEKKVYLNKAEWLQKGIEMASVGDETSENYDKDFAEKSKYVQKDRPFIGFGQGASNDEIYDYINDADGIRENYAKKVESSADAALLTAGYEYMTEKEVATYNYYYNEHGADKANEYLNTIVEDLGSRKAVADFERYEGKAGKELLYGVTAGLDQFVSGVKNAFSFSDEYIPVNSAQQLSSMIREDVGYDHGFLGQVGYDLINTTSNMLPSILVSTVAGPTAGAVAMGVSASGNAYQEMLNLGYDKGQARVYSTLVGASEAGLQRIMGGIGKLGGVSGKLSKMVEGIDNGLAKFAIRWGGSLLSEGFEEATQEVLTPIFQNFVAGYDTGADIDWSEVVYSGLLGALSGGFLEGGDIALNTYAEHSFNKSKGKDIKANERVQEVFDIASNPEVASAYETYTKYAQKGINAENIKDAQLGKLYSTARAEAQSVIDSKNSTPAQIEAAQKVVDDLDVYGKYNPQKSNKNAYKGYDAESVVSLIETGLESAENTESHRLATEYKAKIENYDKLSEIVTKKMNGEELTTEESKILAESKEKLSADEISKLTEANHKAIMAEESKDVATKLVERGESAEVADIVARKLRGETLTTEESEKIMESKEASFIIAEESNADNMNAEVMAKAQTMDKEQGALFISLYDGETDVEAYANAFNLVVAKAENNFTYADILKHRNVLSGEQINKIYADVRIKADQKQTVAFQKLIEKTANLKAYKAVIDDSVIDYDNTSAEGKINWEDLTEKQRKAVTFIKGFAQAIGMNLVFEANNPEYNGKYNKTTNTLHINLDKGGFDAINNIRESLIPTMSHELTHWMEKKSPILYRKINELVFSTLQKADGLTEDQRIAREITRQLEKEYKEKYEKENPGKTISREKARKLIPADVLNEALDNSKRIEVARGEIIARACEDMLSRSKVGREIFNSLSKNEQKTLTDKIKELIQNIKDWVSEALGLYDKASTQREAQMLRDFQEELDKLSALWDEMLTESIEVNQALQKSGAFDHGNTELANVGLQFDSESDSIAPTELLSEKTWRESEYVQDRETAINAIVKALDVSREDAERYVDNINSIARMIADDRARLDYEPNIDEHASALKTNKEYKWTVDMSTLCAKRLLFTGTFDAIQKKLPNTVFNSEEILSLRSMMMERGYEVACGICYVESTRRELGPITAEFIERYKLAQKNGTPISKINSEGKEVVLTEKGTKRNFFAEDGYVPTLAELNTTDIDLVKRDHPEVYAAYLSFMKSRGQAIPKLLETRTEYKGEILKHFNSKSAVKARNDAGGLRVQSFSDFEVAHLIDMMQIVLDMSRVGLMSQAYTKVPAFADVFGNTGMKINLSLIAKGSGLDANGNLIFDDIEGMPHKEAFRLRDKYSKNVGTILVGKNDAHIRAALADPRIDYVIPYHKSFWKESLYEALGLTGYEDYTDTQNEKPFDKERKIKNFQPSEYWDYSKSGAENAQTYLKMCAEDGRIPKFPQFQNCEGYWKLLIDFKMYDNDGVGSPQMTVQPEFSMDEANAIMNDYEGGHREFPVAQDVVDDFVKQFEGRNDILYSEKVTDITEDEYKNIKNHFGVTGNFNVAGYMLKDGKMLDFSGKHWSKNAPSGVVFDSRQVDHRDIGEALPDENSGRDSMVNMISNGNIRLMPEIGGINLAVAPSKNQRVVLRRYIEYMSPREGIIVDIDKVGGDTIKSFTYDKGVSANRVMSDIDNYFKGGTQSELMRFHTAEGDEVLYAEKDYPIDPEIEKTVKYALTNSKSEMHTLSTITPSQNKAINRLVSETNNDLYRGKYTGGKHLLSDNAIKHTLAEHGDFLREALRAQLPMTPIDVARHLSAVKDDKIPKDVRPSKTKRGNASIITSYEVNGYTLYAEEITKSLGKNTPSDLIGHTMYKAPTLATAAVLTTSARTLPKRQSMVLCEYHTTNSNNLSRGNFVADINGRPAKLYFVKQNNKPKADLLLSGLIALSFDSANFTDKSTSIGEGYVVCKNPYYITQNNRVFSNSETNVAECINELKKQGYDCFIFDKSAGDNYMVAVVNKAQIVKDEPTMLYSEKNLDSLSENQLRHDAVSNAIKLEGLEWQIEKEQKSTSVAYLNNLNNELLDAKEKYVAYGEAILKRAESFSATTLQNYAYGLRLAYSSIEAKDYTLDKFKNSLQQRINEYKESLGKIDNETDNMSYDEGMWNVFTSFFTNELGYKYKNDDIRYSEKEKSTTYDVMGETERILKENKAFKEEIDRLNERLAIERKVTNGNYFNVNQLGAVAGHLRNISRSNMDKGKLMAELKKAYSFIAQSPNLTWEEVFSRCYHIADEMLADAKPEVMIDDYFKQILKQIRSARISLSESQKKEAANTFDKHWNRYFFGRTTITDSGTPIESLWQEWSRMYPNIFEADISDGDMIGELYDIINRLQEASEVVIEYNKTEQTRWLANEIYNQYWNVSPIRTTADKYDKKIKHLNAEHRRAMKELRDNYNTRLENQRLADDIHYGKKVSELRQSNATKLAEQKKADRERFTRLYNEIRERKDAEIALAKQLGRERLDSYKENAERKTRIQSITAKALTLKKWLETNSKDYHIHEAMKGPVTKLLQALDFSSKRMLEKGIPTQKDISLTEAFAEVRAMLQDADNMSEGLEALYGHDLANDIKLLVEASYRLVGDNNYVINAMSNEELKHLDRLVSHIKKVVADLNKFHTVHHNQGAINLAHEFMEDGERIGNLKKQHGKWGKYFEFRNRTPYYFFKALGKVGTKLFEAFQDGWDKLSFNAKKVIDFAEETYTAKEVREWSKETKEFKLPQIDGGERTFKMSIAQIMALHCVSKQEDAIRHLVSGGMTLKRIDKKGHVIADYENINLTLADIQSILSTLNERQREVADKLQNFMNTVCSAWGNEISMARFGIEMFGLPDYFPIKVSEATVPTDNTKDIDNASLFRLLNMSFTKSRNQYAEQSIEIGDIFDIFAQHASDMAKYNALALPVLDFNKFYSIHGKGDAGKEYGVVKTLKSVFGDEANSYLRRFVRDLNGSQNVSRDVIGNTFFKNAKLASVANNLRVVLLQPTAFFKASAVMDNKYLLKASAYIKLEPIGMVKKLKKAIANAEKYCGIVQWKSLGYYDTDISKGITEKIKHADTLKDKAIEKSLMGAEIADKVTFGTLWVASEFEIKDTRKDLKVGSEEYYKAVANRSNLCHSGC